MDDIGYYYLLTASLRPLPFDRYICKSCAMKRQDVDSKGFFMILVYVCDIKRL